jgi:selenocysteine-specific elongation factor
MTASVTLATAGHVDHGKTALVRALTGVDTDRLPEERRRGISITCGYAPLALDGVNLAIIDVPGHERFIRAMVGGVGGVDAVMLVVAADEGVMPQTREHLAVCRFLGIPRLVVALTRCDLVDDAWRDLAAADVAETLAGTPWASAPIIACSAITGAGLERLRLALGEALARAAETARAARSAPFAMPVDRVFTIAGFGTVVTGTCLAGEVAVGDTVALTHAGGRVVRSRVRGLERHGERVERGGAGERLALNLPELGRSDAAPGAIASLPEGARAVRHLEALLTLDAAAPRALKAGDELLAQIGLVTGLARLTPLSPKVVEPGERGVVALRLETPTPWFPGVPLILRGFERLPRAGLTLAGGRALRAPDRPTPAPKREAVVQAITAMAQGDAVEAIGRLVTLSGAEGLALDTLRHALPASLGGLSGPLSRLPAGLEVAGEVVRPRRVEPAPEPPREARESAEQRDTTDLTALTALLCEHGLTPPWRDELPAALAARAGAPTRNVEPLVARGLRSGALVRVTPELIYAAEALARLQQAVIGHLRAARARGAPETLTVTDLKELAGATRRWALPLLGWLDRERVTVRDGDVRRLHPRHAASADTPA